MEKYGSDEAYCNVTKQVNQIYNSGKTNYEEYANTPEWWNGSYFMSFKKDEKGVAEGAFIPKTEHEKKLFITSQIAKKMRDDIWNELGYTASCGVSYNKLCAKIASS